MGRKGKAELDPFDRAQPTNVISAWRHRGTLSAASRELFASSRQRCKSTNDADH